MASPALGAGGWIDLSRLDIARNALDATWSRSTGIQRVKSRLIY